jgi:hypothetical protein
VFAGDIPYHRDTTVTGRLEMKGDELLIDLGRNGVAEIETVGNDNAIYEKVKKQAGKVVSLHGQLHEKMTKGTSDMRLVFTVDRL